MTIQFKHISGMLALIATCTVASVAMAQETQPQEMQTIPEALSDLMSNYSGDFFGNRTIGRQASRMVGFGFPERELEWDANATTTAFHELMLLQTTADPTLRVPDLANPYTSSLLTMPSTQTPVVGTEFIFERF